MLLLFPGEQRVLSNSVVVAMLWETEWDRHQKSYVTQFRHVTGFYHSTVHSVALKGLFAYAASNNQLDSNCPTQSKSEYQTRFTEMIDMDLVTVASQIPNYQILTVYRFKQEYVISEACIHSHFE
jgi:hypothetical protein